MANADVRVREIQLLELYYQSYKSFMDSTIAMTHRFRNIIQQKDDEARDVVHRIKDHCNMIKQKLDHAKNDYEAALRKNGGVDENELQHKSRALEKYKQLYKKAQGYEESGKKLYDNVHGEIERMIYMNTRFRYKLEQTREEGGNFLEKAISTLTDYAQ